MGSSYENIGIYKGKCTQYPHCLTYCHLFIKNLIELCCYGCRVLDIMRRDAEKDPASNPNALHARLLINQVLIIICHCIFIFVKWIRILKSFYSNSTMKFLKWIKILCFHHFEMNGLNFATSSVL